VHSLPQTQSDSGLVLNWRGRSRYPSSSAARNGYPASRAIVETVSTLVSVRDKVIAAYEDIMKMAI